MLTLARQFYVLMETGSQAYLPTFISAAKTPYHVNNVNSGLGKKRTPTDLVHFAVDDEFALNLVPLVL